MKRFVLLALLFLNGCAASESGWRYVNPHVPERITYLGTLDDCRYAASVMSSQAHFSDRPIVVFDWDEDVRDCMQRRGWSFHDQ